MKKILHFLSTLGKLLLVGGVSYIFVFYFVAEGRIEREARMELYIEQRIWQEQEKIKEKWEEEGSEGLEELLYGSALSLDQLTSVEDLHFLDSESVLIATELITEDGATDATNTNIEIKSIKLANAIEAYKIWSLDHRRNTLRLQTIKGTILFFLVLAIVGFGLYLSFLQFQKSDQLEEKPEANLKLGPAGIEVSSSVLGVIILAFSTAFLYLYLDNVFQIEVLSSDNSPTLAPASSNSPE